MARERESAEQARIAAMQAELARAASLTAMGEMTASIAHEINQPLAAVVNNASVARPSAPQCRANPRNSHANHQRRWSSQRGYSQHSRNANKGGSSQGAARHQRFDPRSHDARA